MAYEEYLICGISASKLSGLRRCMGACPSALKGYYGTKECQRLDWKRHKLVCRADAAATDAAALPPPAHSEEEDFNLRRAAGVLLSPLHPGVWWEFIPLPSQTAGFGDGWKVVYSIDMGVARSPGVPRRVSATSMGLGQLKHIRYHLNPIRF
ncbi:hypothetical protein PHLGIDRAFT_122632 [Phlebiopsis gigantea 11061_1 CR5-6]|uniref:Uncharacterized protein n=1 Tax=Phlebiopsis gigantea (strain 11061_1 CR5-6) TaxID=745531 RepID=A0A0C3RQT6_PHLG1|nr:hypothetical protein PHLGIDRAFT_122632 [Phlebiopsis gigantea 11061_1 CR5-6]